MLPIETVVGLLMANAFMCSHASYGVYVRLDSADGCLITSTSKIDLRTKVRTYLQSLVPKPKLLSECEAFKPQLVPMAVYRCGNGAYDQRLNQYLDLASLFQVIQPVEVNGENVSEAS